MATVAIGNDIMDSDYDRAKEVKEFDASKLGVKGLLDSGIKTIPRFFVHPPESRSVLTPPAIPVSIPVIDLSCPRSATVDQIKQASSTLGFFQIINHGIPLTVLNHTVDSLRSFHELPTEEKSKFYSRDISRGVTYSTNVDLLVSKAASWRDTIQIGLGTRLPDPELIPEVCREAVVEWDKEVSRLGELLMEMLSEGLGLEQGKFKNLSCLEGKLLACHYYPYCPQPDLTAGITLHTDPGILTVLIQSAIGGLQVKHGSGWADVTPVPGALVINIGDLLQIISNDEYKSVEHRVLANPNPEARISAAVFFNPGKRDDLYGPIPELITPEKPALYKSFTYTEFMTRFFSKELDGKSLPNYYRIRIPEMS